MCNALMGLLETRRYKDITIKDITIKDICREADLSRQTFYQIFDSKEEVIEYQFIRLFSVFRDECGYFENLSLRQLCCRFSAFFQDHSDLIGVMITNNMSYMLEKQFEHYLPQIDLFRDINRTEEYPDYSVSFIAGALCQVLIHWYEKGMDLPAEELGAMLEKNISGKLTGLPL